MKLVAVLWEDSSFLHFGWGDICDLDHTTPIYIITAGIVLAETEDYIVLGQSCDVNMKLASNSKKIPKKSILQIVPLPTLDILFPKHKKQLI